MGIRSSRTGNGISSSWPQWGRTLLLILLAGLLVSVLSFRLVRSREVQTSREEFHLQTSTSEYAVRREIGSNLAALRSLRAFIDVTPRLQVADFMAFARDTMSSNQTILSLEWAPRVTGPERAAFEKELRKRGVAHAYLRGSLATTPRRAPEADEYFPIEMMNPPDESERILGFDLKCSRVTARLLEQARSTGKLTAGGKVAVVEMSHTRFAMPTYMTVFEGQPGHERVRGFALALFQMEVVLEKGLRRFKPEAIDFEFYDLSAPAGKQFLFRHEGASSVESSVRGYASEAQALAEGDFKQIARFEVGGRKWAMVMTATKGYLSLRRTWLSWTILAILLSVTGVVAGLFLLHIAHTRREEELHVLRSRKEAEDALRVSEERYALAARGSKDGLWDWDLQTGLIYYSDRWKSMLGLENDLVGNGPDEWICRLYPADRARIQNEIARHCSGETEDFQSEYRILHKDGSYRWMLSRGVAVLNDQGVATRLAGSQTDITENKAADPLTGLASRLLLNERLQLAIDQARMNPNEEFALLFLDLDRFKVINDSLGHRAGDRLLLEIARRLLNCVAEEPFHTARGLVARLGGDEFVVLIAGDRAVGLSTMLADRIQEAMGPAFDLDGHHMFVSVSIGVRTGSAQSTPETLLLDADTAMYHAKAQGKQRSEVFVPAMRLKAVERLSLETDLRQAIERDNLVVHYQPKVCLATGVVAELEALVRWTHPERGIVEPVHFILLLGTFVLRTACRQMADWIRDFDVDPGTRVSVNLSCRQFRHPDLFGEIMGILKETGLPPERLSLEITEGVLMENMENAIALLNRLRDENIGLQIDDFGTGYSSLSYLRRLPFDGLKIDRSFVKEIGQGTEGDEIVSTISLLGRSLGMSVVAEGVETLSQVRMLINSGCNYAQGFLFSEAVASGSAHHFFEGFGEILRAKLPAKAAEPTGQVALTPPGN